MWHPGFDVQWTTFQPPPRQIETLVSLIPFDRAAVKNGHPDD